MSRLNLTSELHAVRNRCLQHAIREFGGFLLHVVHSYHLRSGWCCHLYNQLGFVAPSWAGYATMAARLFLVYLLLTDPHAANCARMVTWSHAVTCVLISVVICAWLAARLTLLARPYLLIQKFLDGHEHNHVYGGEGRAHTAGQTSQFHAAAS